MGFTLVGGGMQQLSAECISDSKKCINTGQKLAEKEPLDLKYSVPKQLHATRKLHACISTPWKKKNMHPSLILKIATGA